MVSYYDSDLCLLMTDDTKHHYIAFEKVEYLMSSLLGTIQWLPVTLE